MKQPGGKTLWREISKNVLLTVILFALVAILFILAVKFVARTPDMDNGLTDPSVVTHQVHQVDLAPGK